MSGWYLNGKERLLGRVIPADADICVVGVNEDYDYNDSHELVTAFTPYIILPEQVLTNTSFIDGVLRADRPQWLNAGDGINDRSLVLQGAIIYFKDDTNDESLLCFLDSASAGLPQNLIGVNVTAMWHATGICRL